MTSTSPQVLAPHGHGRPAGDLPVKAGVVAGLALLGVLAGVAPTLAVGLAVLVVLAAALVRAPAWTAAGVLFVTLAVPVGWNAGALLKTDVMVGGVSVSISVLLPVAVTGLAVVLFLIVPHAAVRQLPREARAMLLVATVFVAAAVVLAVPLALRGGAVIAARDLQYLVLWAWVAVPVFAWTRHRGLGDTLLFRAVVAGAGAYSLALLLMYAGPWRLRHAIYASSAMAGSDRISFFNGDVLVVAVPLVVCLVAAGGHRVLPRWAAAAAGLVMIVAVALSQTRALMLATVLACCLAWLAIGWGHTSSLRGRMVVYAVAVVAVLLVGLGILSAVGVSRAQDLPSQLSERFSLLKTYSEDSSFQTRSVTLRAALARWGRDPATVVAGDGVGAQLEQYGPVGGFIGYQPAVDNAWVTVGVKGGLLLVVPLGVLLCLAEVAFVRAARRRTAALERQLWRVVAVSFPVFVLVATVTSSHLFKSPTMVVFVASLTAVAALPPAREDGAA